MLKIYTKGARARAKRAPSIGEISAFFRINLPESHTFSSLESMKLICHVPKSSETYGVAVEKNSGKPMKKTKISLAFATKIRARSKLFSFRPANEKRKASGSSHARRCPTSFSTRRRASVARA